MKWILVALMLNGLKPISVDQCDLQKYWVPKGGSTVVPAEYRDSLVEYVTSGWKGSFWVRAVIDDGKIVSAELVSSDPGGPSDSTKVDVVRAHSVYKAAEENTSAQPIEVILTVGPAGRAEEAACAAKRK